MYTVQESYSRVVDMPVSVLCSKQGAIFLTYHSAIYGFVELREQTIQPKARSLLHCMSSTIGTYLCTLTRNLYPAYIFLSQCGPKN